MRKAAAILRAEAHDHARLMAREMGKPVRDGIAEAQKCATGCDFYADNAERLAKYVERGAEWVIAGPIDSSDPANAAILGEVRGRLNA